MKSFFDFTNLIRSQFWGFQGLLFPFRYIFYIIIVFFSWQMLVFVQRFVYVRVIFVIGEDVFVVGNRIPIASRFVLAQSRSRRFSRFKRQKSSQQLAVLCATAWTFFLARLCVNWKCSILLKKTKLRDLINVYVLFVASHLRTEARIVNLV